MRKAFRLLGLMLAACACGHPALAQQTSARGDAGWVGLYTPALLEWLENANRLAALCGDVAVNPLAGRACRDEKLKPREYALQLRSGPTDSAPPEGLLIIRATPGKGLNVFYSYAPNASRTEFVPDLFDNDWGYGPYFHQTFLERRGAWFLLPAVPLPRPAWVSFSEPQVILLRELQERRQVIETPQGDLIVLDANGPVLRARPEQPADMWCEAEQEPPLQAWQEIRIPREKLYSSSGHLLMKIKYTRGC